MFKTTEAKSPSEYIEGLDEPRRSQIQIIYDALQRAAPERESFIMSGMIGFGRYSYKSKSSKCAGEWFRYGLSSLKTGISVYVCVMDGAELLAEKHKDLFPKATVGKSCIKFKKFDDIDLPTLEKFITEAENYPPMGEA